MNSEKGIYIKPTTGLPAERVVKTDHYGTPTLSEDFHKEVRKVREFIKSLRPVKFPPEER